MTESNLPGEERLRKVADALAWRLMVEHSRHRPAHTGTECASCTVLTIWDEYKQSDESRTGD